MWQYDVSSQMTARIVGEKKRNQIFFYCTKVNQNMNPRPMR